MINFSKFNSIISLTSYFTSKKSGFIIKSEDEGEDGWSRLLGLVGDFNSAYIKTAR